MTEVELTEDQRRGLEEAMRWESEALAELGAAELKRRAAEETLTLAAAAVDEVALRARDASTQCANVLRVISSMLQLPPGEWVYDRAAGRLVIKEKHHA